MRSQKVFIYSIITIEYCVFITASFVVSDTMTNIQEPATAATPHNVDGSHRHNAARHQRGHMVGFHLYEVQTQAKPTYL